MELNNNLSIGEQRRFAAKCTDCPLYRNATQTFYGEGPQSAEVMIVGEQPGEKVLGGPALHRSSGKTAQSNLSGNTNFTGRDLHYKCSQTFQMEDRRQKREFLENLLRFPNSSKKSNITNRLD